MQRESLGLVQGTVDVLILRALVRAPMHGYAVSQWIRERSGGALAVEDAALYQALHRLERKGWVEAEWGVSGSNRRVSLGLVQGTVDVLILRALVRRMR